jgi:hypothetical protein
MAVQRTAWCASLMLLVGSVCSGELQAHSDGWIAAWMRGSQDSFIHVLGVSVDQGAAIVEYAAVPEPVGLGWESAVDRKTGQARDGSFLFLAGRIGSEEVGSALTALRELQPKDQIHVTYEAERDLEGLSGCLWSGYIEWRLNDGGTWATGSLIDDRLDAFHEQQATTRATPFLNVFLWPVLRKLRISAGTFDGPTDEGDSPFPEPSRRDECLRFLARVGDDFRSAKARRLVLVARAALGDHSWREKALQDENPLFREAAVTSLGLDKSVPVKADVLVKEMIRGPSLGVRSECSFFLSELESEYMSTDGRKGALVSEGAIAQLAQALAAAPWGLEWEPVATFVGNRRRPEGLAWMLEAFAQGVAYVSQDTWFHANGFIDGLPRRDTPDIEKAQWSRTHRLVEDFTWNEDVGKFVQRHK